VLSLVSSLFVSVVAAQELGCDLPAGSVDVDSAPAVAVVAASRGPLVPSEWRDQLLPAARARIARMRPTWRIFDATETTAVELERDRLSERCGSEASLSRVLRALHHNATVVWVVPDCGEQGCSLSMRAEDADFRGRWTLRRSARVADWVRALRAEPSLVLHGRGGGGVQSTSPFVLVDHFGSLDRARASGAIEDIAWPACAGSDRYIEVVLDLAADGSVREAGAGSRSPALARCLETELPPALGPSTFARGRGLRRLVLAGRSPD
jgi:hypothetical protein